MTSIYKKVRKYEIGGAAEAMPPQQPTAQDQGGGADPVAELQGMVQQYMQAPDPQLADQIIQTLAGIMGMSGGAEQQQAPAPEQQMPAEEMPMGRNGMKFVFKKGGKMSKGGADACAMHGKKACQECAMKYEHGGDPYEQMMKSKKDSYAKGDKVRDGLKKVGSGIKKAFNNVKDEINEGRAQRQTDRMNPGMERPVQANMAERGMTQGMQFDTKPTVFNEQTNQLETDELTPEDVPLQIPTEQAVETGANINVNDDSDDDQKEIMRKPFTSVNDMFRSFKAAGIKEGSVGYVNGKPILFKFSPSAQKPAPQQQPVNTMKAYPPAQDQPYQTKRPQAPAQTAKPELGTFQDLVKETIAKRANAVAPAGSASEAEIQAYIKKNTRQVGVGKGGGVARIIAPSYAEAKEYLNKQVTTRYGAKNYVNR